MKTLKLAILSVAIICLFGNENAKTCHPKCRNNMLVRDGNE